jgi:hypothetical protein
MFLVKSIIFSMEPIARHTKGALTKAQASQLWTSISHLRGSGVRVVDHGRGGAEDRRGNESSASGESIREQRSLPRLLPFVA